MPGQDEESSDSKQRLSAIYENTLEYIGFLSPDGTLLDVNQAALAFGPSAREEVVGLPLWETVWFANTPGAPERLRAAIARAAAGEAFRTEWELRRPSDEVVIFDFSLRPVRDAAGAVAAIIPEGRDITDIKRAARVHEERYQALFERATDGIWLAGQDGRFVDVNPAACALLGYRREEHLRLSMADIVRAADLPRLRALMARLAQDRQVTDVWDIRRGDGGLVTLEMSHTFTPDGLWQASGRDVTQRQRAEAARNRADAERDLVDAARDRADAKRDQADAERERQLQHEHEIAEVLQRSLLPRLAELDEERLAVRYEPAVDALEVGGDWYDVVALGGGRLAVAVGDVVGKGAAAAAMMGQLRSAASVLLLEGRGPAQVLTALDAFAARISEARCSTMFCALIDPVAGAVTYSSAGHPPAILDAGEHADRGGQRYELLEGAQSVPLAVVSDLRRPQATAPMPPGSTLLLYTDGLVERRGQSIDVGIKAAAAVLAGARAARPGQCAARLARELIERDHDDDVAFLLYRHLAPPPPGAAAGAPLSMSFAAQPDRLRRLRSALRDWFAAAGLESPAAEELLHAVGEIASNAIEHGSRLDPARDVAVSAQRDPGLIEVAVSDSGQWKTPVPGSGRGRGLTLARALVDSLEISAAGAGTTVRLTKRIIAS